MVSEKRLDKMLAALCDSISKEGCREADLVTVLEAIGFELVGGKGSHRSYKLDGLQHPQSLHGRIRFPVHDGKVKRPYVREICTTLKILKSEGVIP